MDAEALQAGYRHLKPGVASYAGVLRYGANGSALWTCPHNHMLTTIAKACAGAELDRRRQSAEQVFELLHCAPCDVWFGMGREHHRDFMEDEALGDGRCPRCGHQLTASKIMIIESRQA